MEDIIFKTSLFGFQKSEVYDYIAEIKEEFTHQLQTSHTEHKKEEERLLAQLDHYRADQENLREELSANRMEYTKMREQMEANCKEYNKALEELKAQNEQLHRENESLREQQDSVARVLLVAQTHSEHLQQEAEEQSQRLQEKCLANYDAEQQVIRKFAGNMETLLAQLRSTLAETEQAFLNEMSCFAALNDELSQARSRCGNRLADTEETRRSDESFLASISAEEYELLMQQIGPESEEEEKTDDFNQTLESPEQELLEQNALEQSSSEQDNPEQKLSEQDFLEQELLRQHSFEQSVLGQELSEQEALEQTILKRPDSEPELSESLIPEQTIPAKKTAEKNRKLSASKKGAQRAV